jgi:hypothetical protein
MQTQRGFPKSDNPKQLVSVRYSHEVLAYFKSTGDGWQPCIDGALREYVMRRSRKTQRQGAGPALEPHTCSCTKCRQQSRSLTQMWVEFAQGQVAWTGPGGAPATWRSSTWSRRAFCPVCGSTIGAIDDKPTLALAV